MRLTKKQHRELAILDYFVPSHMDLPDPSDHDVEDYFAFSDRGERRRSVNRTPPFTGYDRLFYAKKNRDLCIATWRQDYGDILFAGDFAQDPPWVVEYVAKAMGEPDMLRAIRCAQSSDPP